MNIFDQGAKAMEQAQGATAPVNTALAAFPGISASAQSGDIILTGTVEEGSDIDHIVSVVKNVAGVTNVTSSIEVADISAQGIKMRVSTENSNLNIRKEPSADAEIIAKAAHNEEVTLVKKTSLDWYYIKTADGEEGYSSTNYLVAI